MDAAPNNITEDVVIPQNLKMEEHIMKRQTIMIICFLVISLLVPVKTTYAGSEPLLGEIIMFAGNFAPRGWALCNGQLLSIAQNSALFSILGTTYGGDGRTTFGLPDLRGRVVIHPGTGPGLSTYRLGQRGGVETVILSTAQMPSHTHGVGVEAKLRARNDSVNQNTAAGNVLANAEVYSSGSPDEDMGAGAVTTTVTEAQQGGNQAHENRPPYLPINFIIAIQGIFPSRS
jgi:microcystin-dependent protein